MRTWLIAFAISFLVGLILTRLLRDLANRYGFYDEVVGGRKLHVRPVPRVGGLAVALAFALPLFGLQLWHNELAVALLGDDPLLDSLIGGGAIILAMGLWDDLFGARASVKLAAQVAAAVVVVVAGVQIEAITLPFLGTLHLGWVGVAATVFWIVLVTNAINLIDGMDGLAGGVVALAGSTLFVMSVVQGDHLAALLLAALVGATLAFLVFNVNPASIFLGDTGSLFLGFLLGLISVHSSQKSYALFSIVAAMLVLALPIFDLSMAVVRRALTGRPLFIADQYHVHHLLLRRGLSQRQSVGLMIGVAAVLELVALGLIFSTDAVAALVILLLVPTLAGIVHFLGYTRIIQSGRRQMHMQHLREEAEGRELLIETLRGDMVAAASFAELWERLRAAAEGLGLERVELQLDKGFYTHPDERQRSWQRTRSAEERGVHLENLERTVFPLRVAGREVARLRFDHFKEHELFGPHDRALARRLADATLIALVAIKAEEVRLSNVLPFPSPPPQQHLSS